MRIEAVKHAIESLPVMPKVLANLRETARLFSTHYSTMIEGNLLTQEQVALVIGAHQHFPGRDRDQLEVRGYYAALDEVERLVKRHVKTTEGNVLRLHALVMGSGKARRGSSAYRDGQSVIKRRPDEAHRLHAAQSSGRSQVNDGVDRLDKHK